MDKFLRPVGYDVEEVAQHIRFKRLSDEDKMLIRSLGFPGTESLFDEDPKVAQAAIRELARTFFAAGPDDE